MKRHNFLLILPLISAFFLTSQSRSSPYVPAYGGKIQIKNISTHNVFIVFETVFDTERMLCIEKNEQIQINHGSSSKEVANPAYYYTNISLYDFDTGLLLNRLKVKAGMFELKSGSIDSDSALFSLTISDGFIGGVL